eukprot:701476-Rhodomonas_salina.1
MIVGNSIDSASNGHHMARPEINYAKMRACAGQEQQRPGSFLGARFFLEEDPPSSIPSSPTPPPPPAPTVRQISTGLQVGTGSRGGHMLG